MRKLRWYQQFCIGYQLNADGSAPMEFDGCLWAAEAGNRLALSRAQFGRRSTQGTDGNCFKGCPAAEQQQVRQVHVAVFQHVEVELQFLKQVQDNAAVGGQVGTGKSLFLLYRE